MPNKKTIDEAKRKMAMKLLEEGDPETAYLLRSIVRRRDERKEIPPLLGAEKGDGDFKAHISSFITRYKSKLRYARLSDPVLLYFVFHKQSCPLQDKLHEMKDLFRGRYIKSDSREQLERIFGAKTETFTETLRNATGDEVDEVIENEDGSEWSGRVDLNHRLHGPEPCALPS
jgi:hypothetical protein